MIHQTLARSSRRRSLHDEPRTEELSALRHEDAATIDRAFVTPITEILDRAHAELSSWELAALLLAVRRASDRLGAADSADPLPIGVAQRFGPVDRLLRIAAHRARDHYPTIGEQLRDYADDVAARPRGAALCA